jgi:hypothetical protein
MRILALAGLVALVSCSHTNHMSQRSGGMHVAVNTNLEADIDVDMSKKIVGKAHHVRILGIHTQSSRNYAEGVTYDTDNSGGFAIFGPGMEEETKAAAAYNATVPNKADVLVAPQYLVKVRSYVFGLYKEVSVQVWGYSGKLKQIRQIQMK